MKKVFVVQRIFSHYRKAVFDKLSDRYDFWLLHSRLDNSIKQEKSTYSHIIPSIKYGKKDTQLFMFPFTTIIRERPDIIIHEGSVGILSLPFVILISKLLGIKFVLWSHASSNNKLLKLFASPSAFIKLFYMYLVDSVLVYTKTGKNRLKENIKEEKIFVAQNTIDTPKYLSINDTLEKKGIEEVKKEISFFYKYNLIFIGRLLKDKHPEKLFDIFDNLNPALKSEIGIHFVGDGELYDELKIRSLKKAYNEHFFLHGAVHDVSISGKYLFASNLMVMPGYLGLSINHSFAFGCPVLSFAQNESGPFHSPEVEFVVDGVTGFLVKEHSSKALAKKIEEYLSDEKRQKQMRGDVSKFCRNDISLENMVNGISKCINETAQ